MGSDYMGDVMEWFATASQPVHVADMIIRKEVPGLYTAGDICDAAAKLVGESVERGRPDPEAEKRLRRLVAVMLELKSLGLLD